MSPVRPIQTSAERPAPQRPAGEVFLRDFNGNSGRRIPRALADRLVSDGIAERVSNAGHVRLRLGLRSVEDLVVQIHGLKAIEKTRLKYGDQKTASGIEHHDRARLRWEPPAA